MKTTKETIHANFDDLKTKHVFRSLLKAAGLTGESKRNAEKKDEVPYLMFGSQGRLIKWICEETNLGRDAVKIRLLYLKLDGYWKFEKIDLHTYVVKILKNSVDTTDIARIPNYAKGVIKTKTKKVRWTINHQTVLNYIRGCSNSIKCNLFPEDECIIEPTVFEPLEKRFSFYQNLKTIAKNTGLKINQVKNVLKDFKILFGYKAYHKPTFAETETRIHVNSKTNTIQLPIENLKKTFEKIKEKYLVKPIEILKRTLITFNTELYDSKDIKFCFNRDS